MQELLSGRSTNKKFQSNSLSLGHSNDEHQYKLQGDYQDESNYEEPHLVVHRKKGGQHSFQNGFEKQAT